MTSSSIRFGIDTHKSLVTALIVALVLSFAVATAAWSETSGHAWMNTDQTPAVRAQQLIDAMKKDQKFQQLVGRAGQVPELPECYGARHVPGLPELEIPTLRITNGPVGVGQNDCVPAEHADTSNALSFLTTPHSAKATALPSAMAIGA